MILRSFDKQRLLQLCEAVLSLLVSDWFAGEHVLSCAVAFVSYQCVGSKQNMLWILQLLVLVQGYGRLPGPCKMELSRIDRRLLSDSLSFYSIGMFTEACWSELFTMYEKIAKKPENEARVFNV